MGPHKNLVVWQKSMDLVREIYQATAQYPKSETYGLVSQMRRYFALGSLNELETQIIISKDLSYIGDAEATELETMNDEVMKMLNSLIYKRLHQDPDTDCPDNLKT